MLKGNSCSVEVTKEVVKQDLHLGDKVYKTGQLRSLERLLKTWAFQKGCFVAVFLTFALEAAFFSSII